MIRRAQTLLPAIAALLFFVAGPALAEKGAPLPPPSLEPIAENVWIHKSYAHAAPWGKVLSQGMVVKTSSGVVLVDTAWNDGDTEKLLDLVVKATGETPRAAIITHAHDDKMGGVGALNAHGVQTVMHRWTHDDAPARNLETSAIAASVTLFENAAPGTVIPIAEGEIAIQYPGAGHTRDNIVVYHRPTNALFGGCLIRHATASSLGNTADGDVNAWAGSVRNVAGAFPETQIVIPSHGPAAGPELLTHTIALAEKADGAP